MSDDPNNLAPVGFSVTREFAEKLVAKGEFSEGGWRACHQCRHSHEATAEQIVNWFATSLPRCRLCGNRTELLTYAEHTRRYGT